MKKTIIFDFFRTLYDPEQKKLFDKAVLVLKTLQQRGYQLYLVSRNEGNRDSLFNDLGITSYFAAIFTSKYKSWEDFQRLIDQKINIPESWVVGDQVQKEITYGNRLGFNTIWIKAGKFAAFPPGSVEEMPDYEVSSLEEIIAIIPDHV